MRGCIIELDGVRIHTGDDLDLVQLVKEIGKPAVQTHTVEVPGRNGLLNMTKSLTGRVCYNNRSIRLQYFAYGNREHLTEMREVCGRWHGKTIVMIDDDTPDYYYTGEADVDFEDHGRYLIITVALDAQPFRYKLSPTTFARTVDGTHRLKLYNAGEPVVPQITVKGYVILSYYGRECAMGDGIYQIDDLVIPTGTSTMQVSGQGDIAIQYREGVI